MTIAATPRRSPVYTGNGVATTYAFSFKVLDATTLVVTVADANDLNSVVLVNGVDYTVTLNPDQDASPGGEIGYAGLPVGHRLVITSAVDASQPTAIANLGQFHANVIEAALDRIVIQHQQQQEQLDRCVKVVATSEQDPSTLFDTALTLASNSANAAAASAVLADGSADAAAASAVLADGSADAAAASAAAAAGAAAAAVAPFSDSSDVAKGDALIAVKHAGASAVARTQHAKNLEAVTPEDFGAEGDGVADDAAALQAALTAATGGVLLLGAGKTYKIGSTVTLPAGTTLRGWGATLSASTQIKMLELGGSDCVVQGLTIVGPSGAYSAAGYGIYASGTRNGAGVAPTMLTGIRVLDCTVSDVGNVAIELDFVKAAEVARCVIRDCGYAGVFVYSGEDVTVAGNTVDTLAGETGSGELNAYGVTFTSLMNAADFVRDPRSVRCRAVGNRIRNVPTWHGLDTHGGSYCEFIDNQIIDCRRGIILTNLGTAGASNCLVAGNTLRNTLSGTNSNGSEKQGEGLWDVGYDATVRNYYNRLVGNTIFQHGAPLAALGAIYVENAEDGAVEGNLLLEPYNNGIAINNYVRRYGIRRNSIVDPKGPGTGASGPTDYPAGINFIGSNWTNIDVSHNTVARKNPGAGTVVGEIGIMIANTAAKSIRFLRNAFDGVVADWYFTDVTGISGDISGTFTGTLTGCTTSPTGTFKYRVVDGVVTLALTTDITGTSNSTAMTITGLPAFLAPAANQYGFVRAADNGAAVLGALIVGTGGTLTFYNGAGLGVWTGSGTKGVYQHVVSYAL